MSIRFIM